MTRARGAGPDPRPEVWNPDIRREAAGIVWLGLAAVLLAALLAPDRGAVLRMLANGLEWALGKGAWWVPALFATGGGLLLFSGQIWPRERGRMVGLVVAAAASVAWFHRDLPLDRAFAYAREGGGLVGASVWVALVASLGRTGALVVLSTGALVAVVLTFQVRISLAAVTGARGAGRGLRRFPRWFRDFFFEEVKDDAPAATAAVRDAVPADAVVSPEMAADDPWGSEEPGPSSSGEPAVAEGTAAEAPAGAPRGSDSRPATPSAPAAVAPLAPAAAPGNASQLSLDDYPTYQLPPLDLLQRRGTRADAPRQRRERDRGARLLEETMASFGIQARVIGMDQGPAVTRYELQPAAGVKVSRIVSLADDIALALAATGVRVVAPIPGKSAVGIEVPNRDVRTVAIREVVESHTFQHSASRLSLALGEDVAGQPVVATLERMLHVLIAGATGSGKSVCLNTLLVSILFKARPDEVKLLLIDPKRVELSVWNGVPHLLAPVITDPKMASGALRWVQQEMVRRYETFADWGVRDIHRFNEQATAKGRRRLPFIVVVIDELADLMMVAARDVEDAIQRLAQMARAAGIHLVVATQRPSVDVITGVIKANIPSRIAFGVSSQADSRTILDGAGAEKLLGKGDMLFYPIGAAKPLRAQGAYISESELEAVLDFVRDQGEPEFEQAVTAESDDSETGQEDARDDLFEDAVRVVLETGQASVSMLQRRLRVGFTRAGRLIDMMERRGFVGPHQGSKAREVLVTRETFERAFHRRPPGAPAAAGRDPD